MRFSKACITFLAWRIRGEFGADSWRIRGEFGADSWRIRGESVANLGQIRGESVANLGQIFGVRDERFCKFSLQITVRSMRALLKCDVLRPGCDFARPFGCRFSGHFWTPFLKYAGETICLYIGVSRDWDAGPDPFLGNFGHRFRPYFTGLENPSIDSALQKFLP
jgi:hypothetical protein